MNLTRTNWPKGWRPDYDAVNGDPDGLLRADNLRFDKLGVVGLVDGMQLVGSASDFISSLYTRTINGVEYVWTATGLPASSISRGAGTIGGVSLVLQDSPTDRCGFGDGLGYIFAVAGATRTKDPVSSGPIQLGLLTPSKPGASVINQAKLTIPAPTNVVQGDVTDSGGSSLTLDPVSLQGVIVTDPDAQTFNLDTTAIGGLPPAQDPNSDIIKFLFTVIDQPTEVIDKIEISFILDGNPTDPSTYENYYSFIFTSDAIQNGLNAQATLSATRGSFSRYGNDQSKDWSNIFGIRIVINGFAQATCTFGDIQVIGGSQGGLNGVYTYICQGIADNGTYVAKSPTSPETDSVTVINGSVSLLGAVDPLCTKVRYYRKSVADLGIDPNTGQSLNQSFLGKYYYIGETNPGVTFLDSLSDTFILQLNADGSLLPNLFLKTLCFHDKTNPLLDSLYGIEGIYNERMLYMSGSFLFLSDRLNPDAIDSRFTLRPSGDPTEKNLWIRKLTNNVLVLATNKSLYEISGTLLEAPDGSIDANIINLGESHPPLSTDVTNYNGGLYYVASDGLRVTRGSNSINVSPQLRHLFQGGVLSRTNQIRHGVPGVAIFNDINVSYSVSAAHGKIYFVVPMMDGTRRLLYYDVVNSLCGLMYTDPIKIFTTQADELLAGYSNGQVYLVDYAEGNGVSGSGIPMTFRTVFDSNNQPRNRKDTFTLKLTFDSGNRPINVYIQQDGIGVTEQDENNWFNLGQYTANGQTTFNIDISRYSLGFRYAIQLTDTNGLTTFKLYELTIEYEPRPEQLNYLRILPANLGSISRKRFTAYAFVIDTLGHNVTFTPYLDHAAWGTSSTVNTLEKSTNVFYFTSQALAVDVGGILSGGPFEFYGVNTEECVSEKLPPPTKYLIIPHNNYGTPNRKRHTSYKFQIDTRGLRVQFTPVVDSVSYTPLTITTFTKQTVQYFFQQTDGDVIGTDIGGILESLDNTPFEFYGGITPQKVETLPDQLQYLRIPNANFGTAARKRARTLPIVIDTFGQDVIFTPIVDGISDGLATTTLRCSGRTTLYHYFATDVFGTDFGGTLTCASGSFEFYELGHPESVEVLPVPKRYDQVGPVRFDKIGKIFGFRVRLIVNQDGGNTPVMPYAIYGDDSQSDPTLASPLFSGNFIINKNFDNIYEIQFPKNVNTAMFRIVFGPTQDSFHRYDVTVKVQTSGMQSESKWLTLR